MQRTNVYAGVKEQILKGFSNMPESRRAERGSPPANTRTAHPTVGKDIRRWATQHAAGKGRGGILQCTHGRLLALL